MKETGIIMSGDHPRKILDGTKTQTRRTWGLEWINLAPAAWEFLRMEGDKGVFKLILIGSGLPPVYAHLAKVPRGSYPLIKGESPNLEFYIKCPYGEVGDKLWVKETTLWDYHGFHSYWADYIPEEKYTIYGVPVDVLAGFKNGMYQKKPSIFMPRRASRIERVITGLRAERLQNITGRDCFVEGVIQPRPPTDITYVGDTSLFARQDFIKLWDSLNAKRGYSWDFNPWCWPISW